MRQLFFFLILLPIILFSYTGPFYVAHSSGNDANDGFKGTPFLTIQKGATRLSYGTNITSTTCYIAPGTYAETVTLFSNRNVGKYLVLIQQSNTKPQMYGNLTFKNGFLITNRCTNVLIQGMNIFGYSNGINIQGCSRIKMTSNLISGCSNFGINMQNTVTRCTLFNNTIKLCVNSPIRLTFGRSNYFKYNSVISNTSGGISQINSSFNEFYNNRILMAGLSGISFNFNINKNCIYMSNIISNRVANANYFAFNITGNPSTRNNVKYNRMYNGGTGISINDNTNFIIGNILMNHVVNGILINSSYNSVVSNTIEGSLRGVLFKNISHFNTVSFNSIYSNNFGVPRDGISSEVGASNNTISFNAIHRNQGHGMTIKDKMRIFNNTVFSNSFDGIFITNMTTSVTCRNNIVVGNAFTRGFGICSSNSGVAQLSYNDVWGNGFVNNTNRTGHTNYSANALLGVGSISKNPLFNSTVFNATNLLYLNVNSPCIDAGLSTDPVPFNRGLRIDMGYYEFPLYTFINTNAILKVRFYPLNNFTHKIHYTNATTTYQYIIANQINSKYRYVTNSSSSPSGWTNQWSTNPSPSQAFNSTNYVSSQPATTNIKWVRFKILTLTNQASGNLQYQIKVR